ncbi:MAG TPA: DUF1080 domain-containing protein [Planctomycetota bacterium]|nr:DUF1080 domain-containing protein [Planctomycetota bacterium]
MSLRALAVLLVLGAGCASPSPSPAERKEDPGQSLFDGRTLGAWKPVEFGGEGAVKVENGCIRAAEGMPLTGIRWTGETPPRTNYEFSVEAMKLDGDNFFVGIVFPVAKETCSFVAGGWGGGVTGLSSVDHMNASENETATDQTYAKNKWYTIRLKVTPEKIEVWVDTKQVVNLELANRQISVHPAVESAAPLGLTNYETTSLFRNIRLKKLP